MSLPEQISEKPRSIRLLAQRMICCEHAKDLINAAERTLAGDIPLPNIAFHLTLLSLEEIGKAALLTSREVSSGNRDTSWIDKRLDDHAFKLLWGLWSPAFSKGEEINPEKFKRLKEFSDQAHEQRLEALYTGTAASGDITAPKDAVTLDEVKSLLAIAKEHLQLAMDEDAPDVEAPNELSQWFWEIINDEDKRKRLFSASFVQKYSEFRNEPREWLQWAKAEFAKITQEEQELIAAELARVPDESATPRERWRLKMRVYCISHSIRANLLKTWNDGIPLVKLHFVSNNEMLLELKLGDQINVKDVQTSGQSLSKLILAAFNVGTAGYFWHERPQKSAEYFEKIEDLDNPRMKIQPSGGFDLQRHWLDEETGHKLTVLEETYINNAMNCALMFMQMKDEEAEPIFGPYLTGLTMLGKSDASLSLEQNMIQAFHVALERALTHFKDWDGKAETFIGTLHKIFGEIVPKEEDRNTMFKHLLIAPSSMEEMQKWAISAKRLVDLYLTLKASDTLRKNLAAIKATIQLPKNAEE